MEGYTGEGAEQGEDRVFDIVVTARHGDAGSCHACEVETGEVGEVKRHVPVSGAGEGQAGWEVDRIHARQQPSGGDQRG